MKKSWIGALIVTGLFGGIASAQQAPAPQAQPPASKEGIELQYVEQAYKACRSDVAALYERLFMLQKDKDALQAKLDEKTKEK